MTHLLYVESFLVFCRYMDNCKCDIQMDRCADREAPPYTPTIVCSNNLG